jgi:hypothetical protein
VQAVQITPRDKQAFMNYPEGEPQFDDESDDGFVRQSPPAKRELNLLFLRQSDGFQQAWQLVELTFQCVPVLKDFFLIVSPVTTWNRICSARRGVVFTLIYYLLPMMFVTAMIEGYGLILLGREQAAEGMNNRFIFQMVFVYEAGSLLLLLFFLVFAALFIKSFANACHTRNRVSQSLIVVLHAAGPVLLIQWLNVIPHIYLWLTWFFGAALAAATLYQGLLQVMKPDMPSAMGLFVSSALTVFLLLFCWRLVTYFYLDGDLKSLEMFFYGFLVKSSG